MGWYILLTVLGLLLIIVLILLLTSIVLIIDTREERFELRFGQLAEATMVVRENHPGISLRIFWLHRFIDFFMMAPKGKRAKLEKKKQKKKKKSHTSPRFLFRMARSVLRTFHVRRLEIDLDTGSGVWNGLLIPLQDWTRSDRTRFDINWMGEQQLRCEIDNTGGRVAWAVIRVFVFGK